MTTRLKWTIALHLAWFPVLFVAWGRIAGEAGSPVHYYWPVFERILDILGVSALASLLLLPLAPGVWFEAARDSRWVAAYPILLLLCCGGTFALCLRELAHMPPEPVFVAPPHVPCWRFGKQIPMLDAAGKPIRSGDLVVIRALPGSDSLLPDTPQQAAQRKDWDGRVVVVTGTIQGGALWFEPTDADVARRAPRFCLWPDNVLRLRIP